MEWQRRRIDSVSLFLRPAQAHSVWASSALLGARPWWQQGILGLRWRESAGQVSWYDPHPPGYLVQRGTETRSDIAGLTTRSAGSAAWRFSCSMKDPPT